MREKVTGNRKVILAIIAASFLVLLAAGLGIWQWRSREQAKPTTPIIFTTPQPELALTPVSSLEELASRYPELGDLLRDPSLDSVYKDFMMAYQQGGIQAAKDLAEERGLLNKDGQVRINLVIDSADNVQAVSEELAKYGLIVVGTYDNLIEVAVPIEMIEQFAQAEKASAIFSQLTQLQHVVKLRLPMPKYSDGILRESEGVKVTGADAWHAAGFTGKGIKVGVLDLGFDGYRDQLGKNLPDEVIAKSFAEGVEPDETGEVHGTACAEVVHSMAPDAELYLAYYDGYDVSMGQAVEWLIDQGVKVITHSATSLIGPMDGTGFEADLARNALDHGILWVNCMGNYALSHYRGTYADTDGDGVHEFAEGVEVMRYAPPEGPAMITLNWDDWKEANQDFNLFVYDNNGELVASSQNSQNGSSGDEPYEAVLLRRHYDGVYLIVIQAEHTDRAVTFDLYAPDGEIEFPVAEHSLGAPADADVVLSVGATRWDVKDVESFSSQGPTNDGRIKPEITAPDGVSSGSYDPRPFYGTSAATPHVAGAAALILSAHPDYTPQQIVELLTSNARDQGKKGVDTATGYGLMILPPPSVALAETASPTAETKATGAPTAEATEAFSLPVATRVATVVPKTHVETGGPNVLILALFGAFCIGTVGLLGGVVLLVLFTKRNRQSAPVYYPPAYQQGAPEAQPQQAAEFAHLLNVDGTQISLSLGENRLGRSHENDIVLNQDSMVSRHHAVINWDGNAATITDLGSSNGTLVNNRRLAANEPLVLHDGDHVDFGPIARFTVRLP